MAILLKNAELTQNEENLRQELKQERDEVEELLQKIRIIERSLVVHDKNEKDLMLEIEGLNYKLQDKDALERELKVVSDDLVEKNMVILINHYLWYFAYYISVFPVHQSVESTTSGHEEDPTGRDPWKSETEFIR